jgi:hypothetical protein
VQVFFEPLLLQMAGATAIVQAAAAHPATAKDNTRKLLMVIIFPLSSSMAVAASAGTTPADDVDQDRDDGDHQQNMDKATHGVGSYQSQEPQDDENDGDCVEHVDYPFQVVSG